MFKTASGEEIFIIDGHVHLWDARKANIKNVHGQQFIDCFYAYHANLSPAEYKWTKDKFDHYGATQMYEDLFVSGYDDMAICQPTYLTDFYNKGFNTTESNYAMKEAHPNRFIVNGAFDPRDGEAGLDYLEELSAKYKIKGVKLFEVVQAGFAVARVERAVDDEAVRVRLLHRVVVLGGVEALVVEVGQIGRLADRHVVVATDEIGRAHV